MLVPRLGREGVVVETDPLVVNVAGKRVRFTEFEAAELRLAAGAPPAPAERVEIEVKQDLDESRVSSRLYLLGYTVEEAKEELERYLERASRVGYPTVTIVHGVGTGALKAALRPHLRAHELVAEIREGSEHEGGGGVTIVALRR